MSTLLWTPQDWETIRMTPEYQEVFDAIKTYLLNPPILSPPVPGCPLLLYVSTTCATIGSIIAQHDEDGKKEKVVYYLSRLLTIYEEWYTSMDKTCLATMFTAQKLAHYFRTHSVRLIAHMDLIKYLFEKPSLSDWITRW